MDGSVAGSLPTSPLAATSGQSAVFWDISNKIKIRTARLSDPSVRRVSLILALLLALVVLLGKAALHPRLLKYSELATDVKERKV